MSIVLVTVIGIHEILVHNVEYLIKKTKNKSSESFGLSTAHG